MKTAPIVLASGSPRRKDLLASAGLAFEVVVSRTEEIGVEAGLSGAETALLNADRKAFAVAADYPDQLVLGADTVVCLGAKHFGKPADLAEARSMLQALSGKTHSVFTAVSIHCLNGGVREAFIETTRVTFRPLEEEVLDEYLATVEVLDKAGSYAIQDRGELLVESISGDRDNVIGLPLRRLLNRLQALEAFPL